MLEIIRQFDMNIFNEGLNIEELNPIPLMLIKQFE